MFYFIYQIFINFTKRERQVFYSALTIFFISLILLLIYIFQTQTIEVPESSNLYREGAIGQPTAINPVLIGNNDTDRDLTELLFSSILKLTEDYKISNNGQT